MHDLKFALRQLLKNPGFTLVAVLTLALGIGANTAMFSLVNAVLLKPLAYRDSERLVRLYESSKEPGWERSPVSPGTFRDWRAQSQVFEEIAAMQWGNFNVTGRGDPERLPGLRISAGLFPMLGVSPVLGRPFTAEEDEFGKHHVALISHSFWQRRFGGDAHVVGQSLTLDGEPYTILGVMPPAFRFLGRQAELWTPAAFPPDQIQNRGNHGWTVVARLKPGMTIPNAQTEMNTLAARLAEQYPDQRGWGVTLMGLQEELVAGSHTLLLLLLCAVGFVLLIACVNVANLMLTRAASRQNEFAIRTAMGAERRHLFRQLAAESFLLVWLGGTLGCLCAYWSMETLAAIAGHSLPRMDEVRLDHRVLGFTLLVALGTAAAFSLVPWLQPARADLNPALKEGGRTATEGWMRAGLRHWLVVTELALSLVLLIGAGLFIRSFAHLSKVNPGFDPARVLTASVNLADKRYPRDADKAAFFRRLLEQVEILPGVQSAGAIYGLPLSGVQSRMSLSVVGRPAPGSGELHSAGYRQISPNYFRTMRTPFVRGRDFDSRDTINAPAVVIVNESFVRQFFSAEDPLGKTLQIGGSDHSPAEVIGVVKDVKHESLAEPPGPEMYVPFGQHCWGLASLVTRTAMKPATIANALRKIVSELDAGQPLYNVRAMETVVSGATANRRVQMGLLGSFAAVAVALAAIGLYGVIAYSVARRTHEIGVRVALGAPRRNVLALVIGQGMRLALTGLSIGLCVALAATRAMRSLLFEVEPTDPFTFFSVSVLLLGVALVACWLPARRAAGIDPMRALRHE